MVDEVAGIVQLRCSGTVAEVVARLEALLASKGVEVFCRISHSDAAAKVGLTMPPTELVIFGNPKGGTPLMVAAPTLAIDLPLKALVWQEASGSVWLSYNSPAYLRERHHLTLDAGALGAVEPLLLQAAQGSGDEQG